MRGSVTGNAKKTAGHASTTTTYQKSQVTRQKIVDAAAKVVSREGYPKASIARITQEAGIASGLFYYYFSNKNELLNQVLPELGGQMIEFIAERVHHIDDVVEREIASFVAYFEFIRERPEFYRLFSEAEVFAPVAYEAHISLVMNNYTRWLRKLAASGKLDIANQDCAALAYSFVGIRTYLTKLILMNEELSDVIPKNYISLYRRMLSGLFKV